MVIVWGVTAVSLLSRLGDALVDVESPPSPDQTLKDNQVEGNASASHQLVLDDFPASNDAPLQEELHEGEEYFPLKEEFHVDEDYYPLDDEYSYYEDEVNHSLDGTRMGNSREDRSKGPRYKKHAKK